MANFSASFGYDLYIMPLRAENVDINFSGVSAGTSGATPFMNISTQNVATSNSVVSYDPGNRQFTVAGTAYGMNGQDRVVRLVGLTNASLETETNSEDFITYDDQTRGFNLSVPTSKTWTISLSGVADFKDAAYHVLRLTELNTVGNALRVKIVRIGPTGTDETIYGYGTISSYAESIEAGSIATWEASIEGYGPYILEADFNGDAAPVPPAPPATYSVSISPVTYNEGSTINANVSTTSVANGTTLFWTVTGGVVATDFNNNANSGSFSVNNNSGSFTIQLANDLTTEGNETFQVELRTGSITGPIVHTSSTVITITDTSTTPPPTYATTINPLTYDEGDTITVNVTTTNVATGTTLFWTANGVEAADFVDNANSGSFTIATANTGSFTIQLAEDEDVGNQQFTVELRTGSITGPVVHTSQNIVINDTTGTP